MFLRKLIAIFIYRPKISLLVTAALCVLLWLVGARFETREGLDSVLDARGGHREVYERAGEVGAIERTLLVDLECERVFSAEGLRLIHEVTEAFLALESVASAKSITHAVMPVRRGFSFVFEPLIPPGPWTNEELVRLEQFYLGHPLIGNVMVANNGRRALITVEYEEGALGRSSAQELRTEAQTVLGRFADDALDLRMIAVPFVELEIREAVLRDTIIFATGSLLLAVVVLRVALRRWRLALVLLAGHLLYLSILPGLFFGTGYRPEPFAVAVFPLLGAVQLALLAHLGAAYARALSLPDDARRALEAAVFETGKSCLFAALTTGAGLLALSFSGTESVRQLGLWGAAGVGIGLVFSFGPVLSMLSLAKNGRSPATRFSLRDAPGVQAKFDLRPSRALIVGASAFWALTVPGLFQLKPDVKIESFLPRGSDVAKMARIGDQEYGGLHFAQLDFDTGRRGGVTDRKFLDFLWTLHQRAQAMPEVDAVYSYPLVLTVLNQVWQGGEDFRLPGDDWTLRMFIAGLGAFNLPMLDALTDDSRRQASLILRLPSGSSERYMAVVEAVSGQAVALAPEGVSVQTGGMVHQFLEADRQVVRSQLLSGLAALAAVFVLLIILWRSYRLTLIGLVLTLLPVASALGIGGYLGVGLNSITVMAGAIALGIAVDAAVHFITCWRDLRRRGDNTEVALAQTLALKGSPIFFTSVILIGMFLLLGFSSFQPVAQLGWLVATALLLTLPSVLLVLPKALLRLNSFTFGGTR